MLRAIKIILVRTAPKAPKVILYDRKAFYDALYKAFDEKQLTSTAHPLP
jgi:hypothetical protein